MDVERVSKTFRMVIVVTIMVGTALSNTYIIALGFEPSGWWPPVQSLLNGWHMIVRGATAWSDAILRLALGWTAPFFEHPAEVYPFEQWPHVVLVEIWFIAVCLWGTFAEEDLPLPMQSHASVATMGGIFIAVKTLAAAVVPPFGAFVGHGGFLWVMVVAVPATLLIGFLWRRPRFYRSAALLAFVLIIPAMAILASPDLVPVTDCRSCWIYDITDRSWGQ